MYFSGNNNSISGGSLPAMSSTTKMPSSMGRSLRYSLWLVGVLVFVYAIQWALLWKANSDIQTKKQEVENTLSAVPDDQANRAADVVLRSQTMARSLTSSFDPVSFLSLLEKSTLSQIRLTKVSYTKESEEIHVQGETNDYRYIAEQLLRFRQEAEFSSMTLATTTRGEDGRISFDYMLKYTQSQ